MKRSEVIPLISQFVDHHGTSYAPVWNIHKDEKIKDPREMTGELFMNLLPYLVTYLSGLYIIVENKGLAVVKRVEPRRIKVTFINTDEDELIWVYPTGWNKEKPVEFQDGEGGEFKLTPIETDE